MENHSPSSPSSPQLSPSAGAHLGLWSGVGLVIANTVGVGVLLSAGFMAMDLTPGQILLCWVVGALMAAAGALTYGALAAAVPRSGGEYRFLSTLLHPAAGYLAGWTSLLLGFSAPVAVAATSMGPFAETIFPWAGGRTLGTAAIVLLTFFHAFNRRLSRSTQNLLVYLKLALLVGFALVGLGLGDNRWPSWQPPALSHPAVPSGFPWSAFAGHLVWVAYAFSGWNAAVYAAGEFKNPRRNVPRAMLLGAAVVALLYLLVNWVFVANLTPAELQSWITGGESSRVTVGHLITRKLLGETGGRLMSLFVLLSLFSSISAMTFVGPRVYAAMADDGFLPRGLASRGSKPPTGSVFLQGAVALVLLHVHHFAQLVSNVGAVLTVISALCALTVLRLRLRRLPVGQPVGALATAGAAAYLGVSLFMVSAALRQNPSGLLWMAGLVAAAALFYALNRRAPARRT